MKVIMFLALAVAASADRYSDMFSVWKTEHGKVYASSVEEEMRLQVFTAHVDEMEAHNKDYPAVHSWYQAINQFSDMTAKEFEDTVLDRKGFLNKPKRNTTDKTTYPAPEKGKTVDWRTKGAVTAVKNQGQCGSCWTFSATGSIEGVNFLSKGKLTSFSEQQIVSCCHVNGAQGCGGGIMDSAFSYVISKGGLSTEAAYPYTSGGGNSGSCEKKAMFKAPISGYHDVTPGSVNAMVAGLAKNPVSIAVDASQGWQTYGGGTLSDQCGTSLDHGVLVVGYTAKYWIVKNSWATTWGEDGYIYLKRNSCKSSGDGECGLLADASYPTTTAAMATYDELPDVAQVHTVSRTWLAGKVAGGSDYEDPTANGGSCNAGEEAVRIQNVQGSFCSPSCATAACPTNVPAGTTAQPECCLETPGSSKPGRCALICQASSKCPAKASCKMVQGAIGICTYDSR